MTSARSWNLPPKKSSFGVVDCMVDSSAFNFPRWVGPVLITLVILVVLALGYVLGKVL